ncbi:uncharacterized protein LOC144340856 [Macaca mulatta]
MQSPSMSAGSCSTCCSATAFGFSTLPRGHRKSLQLVTNSPGGSSNLSIRKRRGCCFQMAAWALCNGCWYPGCELSIAGDQSFSGPHSSTCSTHTRGPAFTGMHKASKGNRQGSLGPVM